MQETWVWSLIWEDPTCCEAPKPVCQNHWACALEPGSCNDWAHAFHSPCSPKLEKSRSSHRLSAAPRPHQESGQSTVPVTKIRLYTQVGNGKISGEFTMWRKSNGVAVWRSQFNLSRIILSIRRISDEEQPQKLSLANTFSTGILYTKQKRRRQGGKDRKK